MALWFWEDNPKADTAPLRWFWATRSVESWGVWWDWSDKQERVVDSQDDFENELRVMIETYRQRGTDLLRIYDAMIVEANRIDEIRNHGDNPPVSE